MKKTLLSISTIFCFSIVIIAQPTLTSANFTPTIGDSQLYYVADTNSVLDNTIGTNVIFDYTSLRTYGMQQTQHYIDPTTTTYTSDFASATFADSTSGFPINKSYSQVMGTDSIMNIGFVGNNLAQGTAVVQYTTDPEKTMEFPFSSGDFFIDPYSGVFTVQGVATNGNGQATVIADAWGSLKLPLGVTIDSVLRVKTIEYLITDTVFLPFPLPIILPITVNAIYVNYYKPSVSKFPLLSFITGSYVQGGALLDSTRNVITQYPMPTVGIEQINPKKINLTLYPNPAKNNLSTLSFDLENSEIVRIDVLNNLGQRVQTTYSGSLAQGNHKISIKTTDLKTGIYFVLVQVGEKTTTQKLVIE